jgi:hypothetical protein
VNALVALTVGILRLMNQREIEGGGP